MGQGVRRARRRGERQCWRLALLGGVAAKHLARGGGRDFPGASINVEYLPSSVYIIDGEAGKTSPGELTCGPRRHARHLQIPASSARIFGPASMRDSQLALHITGLPPQLGGQASTTAWRGVMRFACNARQRWPQARGRQSTTTAAASPCGRGRWRDHDRLRRRRPGRRGDLSGQGPGQGAGNARPSTGGNRRSSLLRRMRRAHPGGAAQGPAGNWTVRELCGGIAVRR